MKIIKEYCPEARTCILRTNTYANTLQHINMLVEEAKKDFPNLLDESIVIVKYAGISYARTYGIEFNIIQFHLSEVPNGYDLISSLEKTY